ncbi:MAG TPA: porin [Pelobium sp.]|nr:porin [Pelobium sp.]
MKKFKIMIATGFLVASYLPTIAQDKGLTFGAYLETYYNYDFSNPDNHQRPGFIYSHNRHNEFSLNLGLLKASYQDETLRGNFSLMTGSYADANLVAEPTVLKHIFEANVGVKLSKTSDLWLDVGVLPSHIGFESAIGILNPTLTRSISAENSPYFETGAKLTWKSDDAKWLLSGLILNGWQRIQRVEGNNTPAFGHQVTFTPNDRISLNSSSFVGNDFPDSLRRMRYFHNLYGIFKLSEKLSLTTGFDIGFQQKIKGSNDYDTWYTPTVILALSPSEKVTVALRAEYYADKNGVIINSQTANGFKTFGFSANVDLKINKLATWRLEARNLTSKDPIFTHENGGANDSNFVVATSLAISF